MEAKLTKKEQELYAGIKWGSHEYAVVKENGRRSVALMRSLIGREEIPPIRQRYFLDPALNIGSMKCSRREVFQRNGRQTDEEIIAHPHFLKYLRYFVEGPRLPRNVIEGFREIVADSLSDGDALCTYVRSAARDLQAPMGVDQCGEEFFKLALECELDVRYARDVRNAARARTRRR